FLEIINHLNQARTRRVRMNIEDEDSAALQPRKPELTAVVRKAPMVRLMASADRGGVDNFAVVGRTGFYIHNDELVRAVAETLDAQCPNINEFLLPFDPGEIGRGAGFVGFGSQRESGQRQTREDGAKASEESSVASV